MSREIDSLRELYMDITDGETITESQEERPSYDPLKESEMEVEREVSDAVRQDGLTDVVE